MNGVVTPTGRIFLVAVCGFIVIAADEPRGPTTSGERIIEATEVLSNTKVYLSIVFGAQNPSVNSYLFYEGKLESEAIYEAFECRLRWGGLETVPCQDWLRRRDASPETAESAYYAAIRARFDVSPDGIRCRVIHQPNESAKGDPFEVLCEDEQSNLKFKVLHAATPAAADLFYVRLSSINGLPLRSILGIKCAGIAEASMHELCLDTK